jgi:hypothetical protein
MEQNNHRRGADDPSNRQEQEAVAAEGAGREEVIRCLDSPLTFAEAEAHNPYSLLTELHEHTMALDVEGRRPEDAAAHHLGELALSAAVVAWWSRWQPITMDRALGAGASLGEVAAAAGVDEAEAYRRWSEWAGRQSELVIGGRPGVDPDEVAAIRERVNPTQGSG